MSSDQLGGACKGREVQCFDVVRSLRHFAPAIAEIYPDVVRMSAASMDDAHAHGARVCVAAAGLLRKGSFSSAWFQAGGTLLPRVQAAL